MSGTIVPLFPGVPGGIELLVVVLVLVLLFGAQKIPKLARSTGEAMGEFQKGREEVEQELEEMRDGVTEADSTVGESVDAEGVETDETTTESTTTESSN